MPHQVYDNSDNQLIKVSVLGAAGGIGQSLSLLLKTQLHHLLPANSTKLIHLALYDVNEDAINGVVADLSHIDTPILCTSHNPNGNNGGIEGCLKDTNLVVIPAGMPRKPGMTRDDLFNINAKIIVSLTDSIIEHCDLNKVFVLLISNPVNALLPVMYNRLKSTSFYPRDQINKFGIERRIFGITNLDIVRASTFLKQVTEENNNCNLNMPFVPVIGGHSGDTIIPLFSQNSLTSSLNKDQIDALITRVQYGGDEIVKAKNGMGSATLSMAHAAFKVVQDFAILIIGNVREFESINFIALRDFNGNGIAMGADKLLNKINNLQFFSIPMIINVNGIQQINYNLMNDLNENETKNLLPICLDKLVGNIENGTKFVDQLTV